MYTINKSLGIGKVESIENGNVTVYFEEVEQTKVLLEKFTKIYNTYEEAEIALNPDLTEEEVAEIMAKIEDDKRIMREGAIAMKDIEAHNIEASKELMKHI